MRTLSAAAVIGLAMLSLAGILTVLVWFANEWVVSLLVTVSVALWLSGWLAIVYGHGRLRAAAVGAVVAGAAYWLLALGPWFQENIGSTLLTSRLLAWVEATYKQPVQQQASAAYTTLDLNTGAYVAANTLISGSGTATTQPQYVITTIPQPRPPRGVSPFQAAGHWSFAWLLAAAGAVLAAVLDRRAARSAAAASEAAS